MKKRGFDVATTSEQIDDGRCMYSDGADRCPMESQLWETNERGEKVGMKLCVGHRYLLPKYPEKAKVFLQIARRGQVPFVPSKGTVLMAKDLFARGSRKAIISGFGQQMLDWLDSGAVENYKSYRDAVFAMVGLEEKYGK